MRNEMLATMLIVGLMTGCSTTSDSESEENENSVTHSQGTLCAQCHSAGSEESFTSGGTIFTSSHAKDSEVSAYATGYTLRLLLENTGATVDYRSGRGSGNSYTRASAGTINSYTAQVLDSSGKVVNSSATDTHDVRRLDCNRCHTAQGENGAPGRIITATSGTNTPTTTLPQKVSLATDVMPILEINCKSCHGSSGNFSVTTIAETYTNLTVNNFLDTTTPSNSRLLKKGSGSISHDGGSVIPTSSVGYQTIEKWIADGALQN